MRKCKGIDKNKLSEMYEMYKVGKITKKEIAKELNISTVTLNKRINELAENDSSDMTLMAMDSDLQIFNNDEFGSVRVVTIDGEPWFIGKDVAEMLGYKNQNRDVERHVDKDDMILYDKKTQYRNGSELNYKEIGQRGGWIINESGLYSLILSSKLPSAKKFKHWITSEVLPSIRKHGAYMTQQTLEQAIYNPDFLIKLATNLKTEQEKNKVLQEKNKQLSTVNAVMVKEANTWGNRSIITHLIRKYGCLVHKNKFALAWNEFYKNLNYKLHINLNQRLAMQENTKKKALDMVKEDEWSGILKIAVAMCEDAGINTSKIIEKHGSVS